MGCVWEQGSLVLLDRLGAYLRRHPTGAKRDALEALRDYLRKVCEVFLWRYAIPLFTVTYEPFWKGD